MEWFIANSPILTWHRPFTLLEHSFNSLNNTWVSPPDVLSLKIDNEQTKLIHEVETYRELIEWPSILDVGKCSLEFFQLYINFSLRFLSFGDLTAIDTRYF